MIAIPQDWFRWLFNNSNTRVSERKNKSVSEAAIFSAGMRENVI